MAGSCTRGRSILLSLAAARLLLRDYGGKPCKHVDFTGKPAWWLKWSNTDLAYKPARRFFVERVDLESASGAKLEGFDVMLSPEDYATLPGKDPEGLHDGPVCV